MGLLKLNISTRGVILMTHHLHANETQNIGKEEVDLVLTPGIQNKPKVPDPECTPKNQRKRRRFSVERKLRILEELDACANSAEVRSILHREGLYSSQITKWRSERVAGVLCKNASKAQKQLSEITERYALIEQELRRTQLRLRQSAKIYLCSCPMQYDSLIFKILMSDHGII